MAMLSVAAVSTLVKNGVMASHVEVASTSAGHFWEQLRPEHSRFGSPGQFLYRGQRDADWGLQPSISRSFSLAPDLLSSPSSETRAFGEFLLLIRFVDHCDSVGLPIPNDSIGFRADWLDISRFDKFDRWPPEPLYELLALAQHHRLPTKLLDWTRRSYVAAYFAAADAVENAEKIRPDQHIAVWALDYKFSPICPELIVRPVPGSNNRNLAAQAGAFTLHRQLRHGRSFEEARPLDEYLAAHPSCRLMKFRVPATEAPNVLELCDNYTITAAYLFPDYYGSAQATKTQMFRRNIPTGK